MESTFLPVIGYGDKFYMNVSAHYLHMLHSV